MSDGRATSNSVSWIYVVTRSGNRVHLALAPSGRTLCGACTVSEVPKPSAFAACLICQSKARKFDAE